MQSINRLNERNNVKNANGKYCQSSKNSINSILHWNLKWTLNLFYPICEFRIPMQQWMKWNNLFFLVLSQNAWLYRFIRFFCRKKVENYITELQLGCFSLVRTFNGNSFNFWWIANHLPGVWVHCFHIISILWKQTNPKNSFDFVFCLRFLILLFCHWFLSLQFICWNQSISRIIDQIISGVRNASSRFPFFIFCCNKKVY